MAPLAMAFMAAGTTMGVMSTLQEGKDVQKLANARALVDIENAKAVERRAREAASIKAEQGRKFLASQKAAFAAGNVRVDIGSPLVIEAQTRADILKDMGYILEEGEMQKAAYLNQASYERAYGKAKRRQSKWDAISSGLMGFGKLGMLGADQGWFGD